MCKIDAYCFDFATKQLTEKTNTFDFHESGKTGFKDLLTSMKTSWMHSKGVIVKASHFIAYNSLGQTVMLSSTIMTSPA